jgi:rubrerythrin
MKLEQVQELVLQSLEHERGGVKVYATAVGCAKNPDLKKEWEKYLAETKTHVTTLEGVCKTMGIDPEAESPGRAVVRHNGAALVEAMKMALGGGNPAAAELVACECVVLAETKDHADWELLSRCAEHLQGPGAGALRAACATVEEQEDEHLYHTRGWCRELWLQSLGLKAILPPPEERQHVKTAAGAAKAEMMAERER